MKAEDQINMLKQISPQSNFEKKQARKTALVLAAATNISILFLIYAFLQKKEADKQAVHAEENRVEAEMAQAEAIAAQKEAEKQRAIAMSAQAEAERQHIRAEQALADCVQNKRK
jgi:hypothetical protein